MTILLAFILLAVLIGAGVTIAHFLPSANKMTNNDVNTLEDLVERKKESNLKAPIFLFSLLVSILFVSWIFDSQYEKRIQDKLYPSKEESLDSVFAMVVSLPPPPKIEQPKPVIDKPKPKVAEIVEVDEKPEEKDPEPIVLNDIDIDIPTDGPSSDGPQVQQEDNSIYFGDDLQVKPEFIGNLKDYLTIKLRKAKAPKRNRLSGKSFNLWVKFIIEKDGSVTGIVIPKKFEVSLDETTKQLIINTIQGTKWTPGKRVDQPVRVNLVQPITIEP